MSTLYETGLKTTCPSFANKVGAEVCMKPCSLFGRRGTRLSDMVNSEGFLAEVFHPWVRWEGPGSGFENSSGAAGASGAGGGGVWKSRIHRFGPRVIEVEKQGFRTAWLISGQKFP